MSLFGPRMWPKWVVFCLNFANWLGSKFGKRGAYHCANVGYLHETETMRYQGNPAVEQRKADAWVDGTCSARVVGTGSAPWEVSLRKLGIILDEQIQRFLMRLQQNKKAYLVIYEQCVWTRRQVRLQVDVEFVKFFFFFFFFFFFSPRSALSWVCQLIKQQRLFRVFHAPNGALIFTHTHTPTHTKRKEKKENPHWHCNMQETCVIIRKKWQLTHMIIVIIFKMLYFDTVKNKNHGHSAAFFIIPS